MRAGTKAGVGHGDDGWSGEILLDLESEGEERAAAVLPDLSFVDLSPGGAPAGEGQEVTIRSG